MKFFKMKTNKYRSTPYGGVLLYKLEVLCEYIDEKIKERKNYDFSKLYKTAGT